MKNMKQYRISKIGPNEENELAELSVFGNSRDYFQGYSINPPIIGERFILRTSKLGDIVINTSPIVEVKENEILTTYSRYKIEEL